MAPEAIQCRTSRKKKGKGPHHGNFKNRPGLLLKLNPELLILQQELIELLLERGVLRLDLSPPLNLLSQLLLQHYSITEKKKKKKERKGLRTIHLTP